jgi:nucleotide-binding universal stress UspA family protein
MEIPMKKILCATDGTDHSAHAIELAAGLAAKFSASLSICAVNVARGGIRGPLINVWEDDEVKKILDTATAHAKKTGAGSIDEIVLRGREVAAAVVQYAEENGYDHIVVGTGDKHGISHLMLGSVAADISTSAHCSVTIAR